MANPNYMRLVRFESELIRFIRIRMNTLRLANLIPTWTNYVSSGPDWRTVSVELTSSGQRKFRAFWKLMFEAMRTEKDLGSVQLAVCYLVRERAQRASAKVVPVVPSKFGIPEDHALKIEELVLRNYEDLNPKC